MKILRSMTSKFDYVVCSIEESNNIDILSIDKLQSSILVHEQRMSSHCEEEQALQVNYAARSSYNRGRGRGTFRGRGRGRGCGCESFDKTSIECFNCHKMAHFQWEYPYKTERKANFAEADEEVLLMAYVENRQTENSEVWYLESGCSNHT